MYIEKFISPIINFYDKPEIQIEDNDSLLWINNKIENISIFNNFTGFSFKKSKFPYYTNKPIMHSSSYYCGYIMKINNSKTLNNIKIGLHHGSLNDLQVSQNDIDFSFDFKGNNSFQIKENNNSIFNTESNFKTINSIQNIDYCSKTSEKKCLNTKNNFLYETSNHFGIIIHNDIVSYLLFNNNSTNNNSTAMIIHQSKNLPKYPIYPCIINSNNENYFTDSNWISINSNSPSDFSIEYLNESLYKDIQLPIKEELNEAPSFNPSPTDEDSIPNFNNLLPWERKIFISNSLIKDNVLVIYAKLYNIDQQFLDRMFGVTIILFNDKNQRKLNIPFIPYLKQKKLELLQNNEVIINYNLSNVINYFYKKNINVQLLFRFGEFTTEGNILSNSYKIIF